MRREPGIWTDSKLALGALAGATLGMLAFGGGPDALYGGAAGLTVVIIVREVHRRVKHHPSA